MNPGVNTDGPLVSTTLMVKLAVRVLPCASVAEQLTGVGPKANCEPDAGVHNGVIDPSTVSVAVAVYVTIAPAALVAWRVCGLFGRPRNGAVVSCTSTVKLPLAPLPCASVTEQFTVVDPNRNCDPDAGTHAGVSGPSTLSFADAK